ncbi:VOC family protein [Pelagerythrobacter rhizovicinus]|uniref:Glyoxalase n=1 Tax=Pelagerythrobacter rhizovicinus TaxID=2268576 RepID=A0A4Q2KRV3_9SPHN|nr:VOC family protein [Pelagerythrobacter rhizovicinus]RXZ66413.1 glyoxalase [Pelagerythrobacter rhizovicinus]
MQPFHLAFPTVDLTATRAFMIDVIGARIGREASRWVDFDLFGHQVTAHLVDAGEGAPTNPVDGHAVPAFHFGVVLEWDEWENLARRLRDRGVEFLIEPYVRFAGKPGEQGTFFVREPAGTALEFKTFRDMAQLFAT